MVRVVQKMQQGENVLRFFARRQWRFDNDKLLQINDAMSEADKQLYPITMEQLTDEQEYMDQSTLVARKYLLKEDPSSIPFARKKAVV